MKSVFAFTLVELLVVITIIVILLALLTPSLDNALHETAKTKCLTNLRAIGQAVGSYINEFKAYPVTPGYFLLFGKKGVNGPPVSNWGNFAEWDSDRRPLNKYLGYSVAGSPAPVAECPSDLGDPLWNAPSCYEMYGNSYHEPLDVFGFSAVFDGRQPFRVTPSHNKVLLAETGLYGDRRLRQEQMRWHQRDYREGVPPAEQTRRLNVLFADLRAEFFGYSNDIDYDYDPNSWTRPANPGGAYW